MFLCTWLYKEPKNTVFNSALLFWKKQMLHDPASTWTPLNSFHQGLPNFSSPQTASASGRGTSHKLTDNVTKLLLFAIYKLLLSFLESEYYQLTHLDSW